MLRFAHILAALTSISFAGCGGVNNPGSDAKEKPKPQVLTVDEFFADTNKEEREIHLVGQLKTWQRVQNDASSYQATIAGEKGKTCQIFVSKPDEAEAPRVGKWIIVTVRGNNHPISRTNGQFTKGTLHLPDHDSQAEALKTVGR